MVRSSFAVRLRSAGAIVTRAATVAVALLWPSALFGQTWQVVEYYDTDAVGSVRVVTDAQGQVVARHDFLPFGEELSPQTPPHDKKLFTGQERDVETGQDYVGARYYQAAIGRFTTIDPVQAISENLTDPQRWNRYVYVQENPLRYIDPDGRWARDVHYDLTRALAYAAGFTLGGADVIARLDDSTDHGKTGPLARPLDYHFTTSQRREEMLGDFLDGGSTGAFGRWLHAGQDSFIHAEGAHGLVDHQLFTRDDTSWSLGPAMSTAVFTYTALTADEIVNTLIRSVRHECPAVPFSLIEGHVRRYLRAGDQEERDSIIRELMGTVDQYRRELDQ